MSNNISNLIILTTMVILASFCAGFLIMSVSQLGSLHENIISETDNSTLCDSYANADNISVVIIEGFKYYYWTNQSKLIAETEIVENCLNGN